MMRHQPNDGTAMVSGVAEFAAAEVPSALSSGAGTVRPDRLDKAMVVLTVCVWGWQYLLVVLLFYVTSEQPSDAAVLAMRAIGGGAGIVLSLALYLLLRRSGETRPWPLLFKAVAASLPLSVALAFICQLGAHLTSFYQYHPENWMDPYLLVWGSFDYLWVLLTWSALLVGITMVFEVSRRDQQIVAMREAAQQAQLLALRLQINPHFLFNTFNTLAGFIVLDRRQESERMVLNLSRFLRHTLTRAPSRLVRLSEEVEMIRMYLEIEMARFGDRLAVHYDVPEECSRARVPGLVLLPLTENSIKYALNGSEDGIEIRIGARREGDTLSLWLEDTGTAPANGGPGLGIGLGNTRQQLDTLYGSAASLAAGPGITGWRNRLRIPWQEDAQQ